ncbi:MAG: Flp family type IVb pilin [Phycisphaerae bacterium]|nr:Flp family type IVb pilin [Phycisphaerae bacterium]
MNRLGIMNLRTWTRARLSRFIVDESGPTATEYAFLLAVILLAAIGAISALGETNSMIWATVGNAIGDVM